MSDRIGKLVVTGVEEPLGRDLVDRARAAGIAVRGLPRLAFANGGSSSMSEGALADALEGATHVVDTGADTRVRATYDELAGRNLDGTRRVYEAARAAGVKHVLFVGLARICQAGDRAIDESSPVEPATPLEQSLYDAEILLRGLANRHPEAPRLTILRHAHLYGQPTPPERTPWWAIPPILAVYFDLVPGISGGPRTHWVHLEDVARAALHLLARQPDARVETYHVADDTPVTLGELFNLLIEAYGLPLGIKVPYPAVGAIQRALALLEQPVARRLAVALLDRGWRAAQRDADSPTWPRWTEAPLAGLVEDIVFRHDALDATGFELIHPDIRVGMQDVIGGYQKAGLLPRPGVDVPGTQSERGALGSSFAETMQGAFRLDGEATDREIVFDARLTSAGLRLPITDHLWHLDGELRADGLAESATIRGTLDIAPMGKRRLTYEFGFRGDDGRNYRLTGVKRIRYLNLRRSLTEMTIRIIDDKGRQVATGDMYFDLGRDIVEFVRGFRWERGALGRAEAV